MYLWSNNHKSIKMKKLLILITLFIGSNLIAQENLGLMDFRKVPADEMKTFMQNEYVYWSKVAKVLKEKGQISYWSINVRSGGARAEDSNVMAYIGVGSWENYENLGKNYAEAEAEVKSKMDAEKLNLIEENLKQEKFGAAFFLINNLKYVWAKNQNWKYKVVNYANAKNALDYTNAEAELMAPYFEKAINSGKTKLQGWKVSTVLSPQGYDFPFNSLTVDFYKDFSDIFTSWPANTQWPEGIEELNKLKENEGFWRRSIWQRVMYLDSENNLKTSW